MQILSIFNHDRKTKSFCMHAKICKIILAELSSSIKETESNTLLTIQKMKVSIPLLLTKHCRNGTGTLFCCLFTHASQDD